MQPKQFLEIATLPQLVPDVWRFCDQWCKRCRFQERCLIVALAKREADDLDPQIGLALEISESHSVEVAQALDRDPDAVIETPGPDSSLRVIRNRKAFDVYNQARHYLERADDRLKALERFVDEIATSIDLRFREGRPFAQLAEWMERCEDALEIIFNYKDLMVSKLFVAASQAMMNGNPKFKAWDRAKVMGSAKTALILVRQSLKAWRSLQELLTKGPDGRGANPRHDRPAEEWRTLQGTSLLEGIEEIIPLLETLEEATEKHFPRALAFQRPGLDDPAFAVELPPDSVIM